MDVKTVSNEIAMGGQIKVQPVVNVSPNVGTTSSKIENETKIESSMSYDKDTNMFITKFVDANNKEVVKQYPPQEIIDTQKAIGKMIGNIINEKV